MPSKTPAILSTVLTILILIVFAVLSVLTQMLVLNGASENQGTTAMGIFAWLPGTGNDPCGHTFLVADKYRRS